MIPAGIVLVARDRRPLVCRAVSALRLDLHHVVHPRREHRALHRGGRRREPPRTAVLHPRRVQRFVPLVALSVRGGGPVAGRLAQPRRSGHATAAVAAPDDRAFRVRTLLWLWVLGIVAFFTLVGGEAGPLHLPHRAGGRGARGLFIARDGPRGGPARPAVAARRRRPSSACLLALAGAGTLYVFQSVRQGLRAQRRRVRRRRRSRRRGRRAGARAR